MPLTLQDVQNFDIYLENKGTLSSRIDFAWTIYSDEKYPEDARNKALGFLVYAYDLNDLNNLNEQLIVLMAEKDKYRPDNSEYIPTKAPDRLPFHPGKHLLQQIPDDTSHPDYEVYAAIKSQELLDVGSKYKAIIDPLFAQYLNKEERASYRVHIRKGVFEQNGETFDTSLLSSKGKDGYASYTLNANGELSVFSHISDKLFHSSMNGGSPVVAAGELKIENGVLTAIPTSSGHYRPTLFTVYRALEYFYSNNVDLASAYVLTAQDPSDYGIQCSNTLSNTGVFETPAIQIFYSIKKLVDRNIDAIHSDLKAYKEDGFLNSIYRIKDVLIGSDLTERREDLANRLATALKTFKHSLKGLSTYELKLKIDELEILISAFDTENKQLSAKHGKDETSGRIAERIDQFKEQLNTLKQEEELQIHETLEMVTTMKKIN